MVAKDDDDKNKKAAPGVLKGLGIEALEMESLNPTSSETQRKMAKKATGCLTLIRLYMEAYPPLAVAVFTVFAMIFIKIIFFRHRGKELWVPPHLQNHYGDVQSYYDLQMAQIDHWCLRGGNDHCTCDDPNEELSREEAPGWLEVFKQNKEMADAAIDRYDLDVVFLGDEFIQAYTGKAMTRPIIGGAKIATYFRNHFSRDHGAMVDGVALGISGDSIPNLLYRIKHGEMPEELKPKVWWILIGANDLVRGQCSEEAIILGILRLADEIAVNHPGSIVVIQGLLPRTSMPDGHVHRLPGNSTSLRDRHKAKEFYKTKQYPLWPSIRLINDELERFCAKHEHMVYFDTSSLFFATLSNSKYKSDEKILVQELMPDFAHPSVKGYELLATSMAREIERIIYDEDEDNYETEKSGENLTPDEDDEVENAGGE